MSAAGYTVRWLTTDDLAAAAAVEATAPDAWSEEALAEEAAGGAGRVFVLAAPDGTVAGVAVFQLAADEVSLHSLTLLPALRGQGLGQQLMNSALDALHGQGATRCFLEVRAHNIPALALYARLGFAEAGRRKNFYRIPTEDALVLVKNLE